MTNPNLAETEGAQVNMDATTPDEARRPEDEAPTARAAHRDETRQPAARAEGPDAVEGPGGARPEEPGAARRAEDTVVSASPAAGAAHDDQEESFQRAYLLQQLQESHGGQLAKGKANRFPRAVARELNLSPTTANRLRDEMVRDGYIRLSKKGGSVNYELTDEGRAHLETLPQKPVATGRRGGDEGTITEEVRRFRRTFLLFQLFEAEGNALDQKAINRFREPGRKFLDLKAPAANEYRRQLADEGLIEADRAGRNATFKLTEAGRDYLGATAHFPDIELTIAGRVMNELLEAARMSSRQFESPGAARVAREATTARQPQEAAEGVT